MAQTTISSIRRAKENLIKKRDELIKCQGTTSKKRCTGIENTELDQNLYKWFLEQKNTGQLVTGVMIQKKALEINKMLNGTNNFKASKGFLDKFKKRYNIILPYTYKKDDVKSEDQDECNFSLKLTSDNDEYLSNQESSSDNDECISIHEQEWKVLNNEEVLLFEQCKNDTNCVKHEEGENNKSLHNGDSVNDCTAKSAFDGIHTFISWYQTQMECTPQDVQQLWKFWKHALNEVIKNENNTIH